MKAHLASYPLDRELAPRAAGEPVAYGGDRFALDIDEPEATEALSTIVSGLTTLSAEHCRRPTLFHLPHGLPASELETRVVALERLLDWYRSIPARRRDDALTELVAHEPLATLEPPFVAALRTLWRHPAVASPSGAENINLMLGDKVVKISRDRHHHDFCSVLRLARNMCAVILFLDGFADREAGLACEVCYDEIFFVRSDRGFLRLMVQNFEADRPIRAFSTAEKRRDPFRAGWRAFLHRMERMLDEHNIVLDLTDSKAGNRKARGNVMNTDNVVVRETGGGIDLKIVDPDVFDGGREHKFCPSDYLRPSVRRRIGPAAAARLGLRACYLNFTRKRFVQRWQTESIAQVLADRAT